jgi:YD repeat-containing protein
MIVRSVRPKRHQLNALLAVLALAPAGSALAQQTVDYQYDRQGRLTRMADGSVVVTYAYDPGGNLLRRAVVADGDGDRLGDDEDNCPFFPTADQTDADEDGRGDACECGDQNGDGSNTVSDLVAINVAIFNPGLATPLCDANNDDQCDVNDLIAANIEIFSPTSTSTCSRQPVPGP